jgi:hypothetical protein
MSCSLPTRAAGSWNLASVATSKKKPQVLRPGAKSTFLEGGGGAADVRLTRCAGNQ